MNRALILLIKIYQFTVSPFFSVLLGPSAGCRFEIPCSQYMINSLRQFGTLKGGVLGLKRLARCRP